ncbi:MAG: SIS domain-containing protein [Candidatus Komeilibacteria bacterium]|nr:SIS domain-containing protein [Candidatus Komeilibacteria bacterium]
MKLNEQNYLKSIELLGEQIKQSYFEAGRLKLPASYRQINKIAVFGMGGSQLGTDLINNLFSQELKVPIIQIRDYSVPGFVDANTLVLLLSYSGTTEEVLAVSQKLSSRNKVVVITVGGKLSEVSKKNHWPMYQFDPRYNPSGQPRMGTGYLVGSVMAILKKLNLLAINDSTANQMIVGAKLTSAVKLQAKKLAKSLKGKTPIIIGAEHLFGNAHIMTNQINESSKQRCYYFALPELNHHLLEGLSFPSTTKKNLVFVFLNSKNYFARNKKRFALTEQVVNKQGIGSVKIDVGGNKVQEAIKLLGLGGLLSYELTKINKVEPDQIPWVNYFKEQLGK